MSLPKDGRHVVIHEMYSTEANLSVRPQYLNIVLKASLLGKTGFPLPQYNQVAFEGQAIFKFMSLIEKTKKRLVKPDKFDLNRFAAINRDILQLRIDTLGEEAAKNLSVEDGKRSPVELY